MKLLFLCVANSARSQMAEGLARKLYGDKAVVSSAGSEPSKINPFAVQAMKNIGIDISSHYSKPINEVLSDNVDLVITLCVDEVCPIVPTMTEKEHWPFQDPASAAGSDENVLKSFEDIRDKILTKLIEFGKDHSLLENAMQDPSQ